MLLFTWGLEIVFRYLIQVQSERIRYKCNISEDKKQQCYSNRRFCYSCFHVKLRHLNACGYSACQECATGCAYICEALETSVKSVKLACLTKVPWFIVHCCQFYFMSNRAVNILCVRRSRNSRMCCGFSPITHMYLGAVVMHICRKVVCVCQGDFYMIFFSGTDLKTAIIPAISGKSQHSRISLPWRNMSATAAHRIDSQAC